MRNLFLLCLSVLFAGLISCTENEEPISPLIGNWENRVFVDSLDVWYVNSYRFKNDSIFDLTSTVRESESGEELGYRIIATSWYNLEESIFQFYYSDALIYFGGGENNPSYGPKDKLRPGVIDFFRVPKGELTFSSDMRQFTFQEDCWEVDPDSDCIEFPSQTFVRID